MASSQGRYASASLYVGDLDRDATEAQLYEIFNSVGPVASIRVCKDSVSRRSLGYAYVNYHSVADAERALDTLNYTCIKKIPCRIMWCFRDPVLRKSGTGNIFVKNLDKGIDNKALYDTFSLFGNILSCKVAQDENGRSRGFGFVHYELEESAQTAINRVNGMQIGSKQVYVGPFVRRGDRQNDADVPFTNLYIKNIPDQWDESKLLEVFGKYGEISSAVIKTDNRGRKFGFANFTSSENAKAALQALHMKKLNKSDGNEEGKENDKSEEDNKKAEETDDDRTGYLWVSKFQPKSERAAELKSKFQQSNAEQRNRPVGNLYIKNIDDTIDSAELRKVFEQYGGIISARVMTDHKNTSRGFGFVCFANSDDASKAVSEMHGKMLRSKPLYVGLAERRDDRIARLAQKHRPASTRVNMGLATMPPQVSFGAPAQMYYGPNILPSRLQSRVPYSGPHLWPRSAAGIRGYGQEVMQHALPQQMLATPQYPQQHISTGRMPQLRYDPRQQQHNTTYPAINNRYHQQQQNQRREELEHNPPPAVPHRSTGSLSDLNLSEEFLAGLPMSVQKQMIGEKLFPLISKLQPQLAGKITGMMLDMENTELLALLDSDAQLKHKVDEALHVLQQAHVSSSQYGNKSGGGMQSHVDSAAIGAVE